MHLVERESFLFIHFYDSSSQGGSNKMYDAKNYELLITRNYSGNNSVESYVLSGGINDDYFEIWGKLCIWANFKEYWRHHYFKYHNRPLSKLII